MNLCQAWKAHTPKKLFEISQPALGVALSLPAGPLFVVDVAGIVVVAVGILPQEPCLG